MVIEHGIHQFYIYLKLPTKWTISYYFFWDTDVTSLKATIYHVGRHRYGVKMCMCSVLTAALSFFDRLFVRTAADLIRP